MVWVSFGVELVKKESRERFLALADWAIQKLGFEDWNEGLQFASDLKYIGYVELEIADRWPSGLLSRGEFCRRSPSP